MQAFKTRLFSKAAQKARIGDKELFTAMEEMRAGQAEDLGGGVFKKRLNKNMHRCIVLAKGGHFVLLAYLFRKERSRQYRR